jgi:hypothetical protein
MAHSSCTRFATGAFHHSYGEIVLITERRWQPNSVTIFTMGWTYSSLSVRSLLDPGFLRDQFPGVSVPSYFSSPSSTHFLQIIFDIVFILSLKWPPSFWDIRKTRSSVFSSGVLSAWPHHRYLPRVISGLIYLPVYRSINLSADHPCAIFVYWAKYFSHYFPFQYWYGVFFVSWALELLNLLACASTTLQCLVIRVPQFIPYWICSGLCANVGPRLNRNVLRLAQIKRPCTDYSWSSI